MGDRRRRKLRRRAKSAPEPAASAEDAAARARRALRLLVIVYLFLAAFYARSLPAGKGPDESAHIRYVTWLAEHRSLPVFDARNPGPDYEFHQPPLFYALCVPTYLLAGPDRAVSYQALRFTGILLGIALLYLTFALTRALAPERPWAAVAAAAVVAFLPMHLSLVASVSNDVLTEVLFAAALLLAVRYLAAAAAYREGRTDRRPGPGTMAWAGAMAGLGLLTKSIAILLLPVIWAAAALAARGPQGYDGRRLLRDVAVSGTVAAALAGWWLVRNQILYGDLLAQSAFLSAFQDRPSPQAFMARYDVTPVTYVIQVSLWTLASILGVFGPVFANRFAFFPYWVYLVFGAMALGQAGGYSLYLARARPADWQRQAWLLCALLGALLLAGFIGFNLSFFQAQARYLFPALPAAAAALCIGLEEVTPIRWRPLALAAAVGLLLLLASAGLLYWIVPQFSIPPPPDLVGPR